MGLDGSYGLQMSSIGSRLNHDLYQFQLGCPPEDWT